MGKQKQVPAPVVTKEQYEAMTPAQRRVALATDVLALLKSRVIRTDSTYFWPEIESATIDAFVVNPRCEVCARGALAVAWARSADAFEERGLKTAWDLTRAARSGRYGFMAEVFGNDEDLWSEIENAFEGYDAYSGDMDADKERSRWHRRYRSQTARLRAICENLIANGGAFVPVPAGGAS